MNTAKTGSIFVAVVLLLGLAGCGESFGITPSTPLGTVESMEPVLVGDKGLEKTERVFTQPECFSPENHERLKALKVYQYQEFAKTSQMKHVVLIGVDGAGQVRAVGGSFHSGQRNFSDAGSKVESFLATLFAEVNGAPPEFTKENEPGIDVNEYLITKFDRGSLHGIWKKIPSSGEVSHHRSIQDFLLLWID